jgi:hypothetical protein
LPIRSVERRRWSADLMDSATAGLVLHGIGGVGKSALAAEIVARAGSLEPERMTTVISGEVSADDFLAGLAAGLRRHPQACFWGGIRAEAVAAADRIDLPVDHRLALLRDHIFGHVPVLVALDNFDDNLVPESGGWAIGDPALAGLLANWAGRPQLGRLLVTCRHPFSLPGGAEQGLGFRRLGPLSRDGAFELARSLPSLRPLDEQELDRAWRLLGGHPRAMEYLDAVLSAGRAPFPEVARRLAGAVQAKTGQAVPGTGSGAPTALAPVAAEATALAACDLLLADLCGLLSASAEQLLIGASVYRAPIACDDSLLPVGQPPESAEFADLVAECEATGLLTADRSDAPPSVFVHRWTASEMHCQLAEARRGDEVTDAHRRAAGYWQRRITVAPQDGRALLEAGYHLRQVGEQARLGQPGRRTVRRRRLLGLVTVAVPFAVAVAVAVSVFLTAQATGGFSARKLHLTRISGPASHSAAIRDQAAKWVARQVSKDAIVACDPAMCSALQTQGIGAGNLLVLGPATPDPLGSDVVMATAAVRSQFGARLANVYAPAVLARFGSGGTRVDVRVVPAEGAAAYRAALVSDLAARRKAGSQLLANPRIAVTAAARHQLFAGRVDPRLLITLAAVAAAGPVQVTGFTDAGPRASPGTPLRAMTVATPPRAAGAAATLRSILAFVRAQRAPYLPAQAAIVRGAVGLPVLNIEFTAPSPVGLLHTQPHRPAGIHPATSHRRNS